MMAGLWAEVITVWETAVFGIGIGEVLLALAVFVAFQLLRGVFTSIVLVTLGGISRRTISSFDD